MGDPIRKVTIVGGGTAGWMSALMLQGYFQRVQTTDAETKITLIESPDIPTVGVGEATVPGMPRSLQYAGISEQEFFKTCNASFKLGVLFKDWNIGPDGKPVEYVNPFAAPKFLDGANAAQYFLQHMPEDMDFTQTFSPAVALGKNHKGPRPLGEKPYTMKIGHAYHLDAGKFAKMLAKFCAKNGVEHIEENVTKVEQDERGYVTGIHLEKSGLLETELVIDCTGFRGVVINEVMDEPFISYSKYLANDRAMAVQIPHPSPDKIPSLTRSTALGAGWVWRVPLYNRIGTGYVYSSAHRTDEQARDEFVAHLGDTWNGVEPRVIPMRIGRNRNAWVKNVVAIGLSGGFIEPLESTAIHMIDTGIRWLTSYFPDSDFAEPLRKRYNRMMGDLYNEVRDFICLHYALGNRTDSQYWIDAREELDVPDSLAENLELWRYAVPGPYDLRFDSLFSFGTYQAVILGKRVYETGYAAPSLLRGIKLKSEKWDTYLNKVRANSDATVRHMADHKTLLRELRGELPKPKPALGMGMGALAQPTVSMPGMTMPNASINPSPAPAPVQDDDEEGISLL